ncbi:aldehyde dehydrogenase family protein [Gottfriedia acidiceleris]|uniref:aldehyde dehydrogenase family protein n=1 Tax=Gottfriedia acidiceleris TaxID=371036 RepID=UPI003D221449
MTELQTKLLINGIWREGSSGNFFNDVNPYNGELIIRFRLGNKQDINEAYDAAKSAQKKWAKTSNSEKKAVITKVIQSFEKRKDEIIELLVKETGSSYIKANSEYLAGIGTILDAMSYIDKVGIPVITASAIPGKENIVYHEPAGVIGVISPFNFPFFISLRAVAPAIAVGDAVVLKTDPQTQLTGGAIIAEVFEEAGLPRGVLNMVNFDVSEVGDYFIEHPIPSIISFTGSTNVGRHIASLCGKHLKRVALELGGNNPMVILEDANIDQAVNAALYGKFMHQGQVCVITNRILVHQNLYDEFVKRYVERAKQIPYGDPSDPKVFIGPLINEKQIQKVLNTVEIAKEESCNLVLEGKRVGNVITPYVFSDVKFDSKLAQTEVFGPIATIIPFKTLDDALDFANHTEYGLSSAVFTLDIEKGLEFAKSIESGMSHVNDITANIAPNMPFGGIKGSGHGRYGGEYGFEEFTTVRWITVQKEERKYPV